MMRLKIGLLIGLLSVCGLAAAEDTIYKCRSVDGSDVYSDKPCAAAKDMQQIRIEPARVPDIANVAALCASEDGARRELAALNGKTLGALPRAQRDAVTGVLADYTRSGVHPGARWGRGSAETVHLCLPTAASDMIEYVATVDGKMIKIRGGMVSYLNDPDTPAALLDRCEQTWHQCISVENANPDSCMAQVPTCTSSEPWKGGRNCCPIQCKTAYSERRAAGEPGSTAFLGALYGAPSCVPGLTPKG